ncbi:efflux RND transporter periplasmic adaptor subunit [Hydromonas duriensis]|uniref:Membrane fusion protein (Multidrug efflux system) n=1 Tax=Hydromonas duriensis TaxID=1527608 RepID=A0A4R6YAL7_9BURK|nr:efflux RND transporter periplasmic adaptor subunit [Hydromonas duriensis]TDR32531.1 membrane fusion protein (multidrug efflux system) [Hydromonas duriensis]
MSTEHNNDAAQTEVTQPATVSVIPKDQNTDNSENERTRKRKMLLIGGLFLLAGLAWLAYYFVVLRYEEETDNAYVNGNIVAINAQTGGTVEAILADENQEVHAGQPLVKLSPTDAEVALSQARAQLSQTVRQIQQSFNNANVADAQLFQARVNLKTAQDAVNRRAPLVKTGAVSKEEFAQAQDTLARAQAALGVAQAQRSTAVAQVAGTTIANHPVIEAAKASFRTAYINNKRLAVLAPMDGFVAKRYVQVGQQISPGTPLMNLVAANQVWVDANFKETQLANLRVGQPVTIKSDMYGSRVTFDGEVQGIAIGTGSAFSVLPAQNATGNWIKIVQRVPVRILLKSEQLAKTPLRVGMSMIARVDTHKRDGAVLGAVNGMAAPENLQTTVYQSDEVEANAEADKIIKSNLH